MHGIRMTDEIRKMNARDKKIYEGALVAAGGVVAIGIIAGAPLFPWIIIGKRAFDKVKEAAERRWLSCDVYES